MNTLNKVSDSNILSLDSYEKGRQFEAYIKGLFNEDYFRLVRWRESKKKSTSDLIDCCYPDLELIFARSKKYKFAVECKWRQKFDSGMVNWAKRYQIERYQKFESIYGIPVFVAIGIGGNPSAPEKLFVTPLQNISNSTLVYEEKLIPYKRKAAHKFFYDTVQLKLF